MSRLRLRRSRAVATVSVALVVVTAACAGWAFTVLLSPAAGVPAADGYTLVTTTEGEVGSHLTLNVAAKWNPVPVGTNEAAGVVTTVDAVPGQLISSGDRLYSVDLRPVVAAVGAVPAYRMIGAGESGADVVQLQAMLAGLGLYAGTADGVVGSSTTAAIERWQTSLGVEATGRVELGDVIFVPQLPARLVVKPDVVHRGATLSGAEAAVQWLGATPEFTLPVSEAQSQAITTGTRVLVDDGRGYTWNAVTAGRSETATGTVSIALVSGGGAAPGGGAATGAAAGGAETDPAAAGGAATDPAAAAICGDTCDTVPVDGQTLYPARVVTVETAHGVVVPSAALQTDAAEQVMLVDQSGAGHPVRVIAQATGMSVVTGVDVGLAVRVPADAVGAASFPVPSASATPPTTSGAAQ